jgi:hypothetical protein
VPIENVSQHTGAPLNPSAATSGPAQDHFSANLNGDVLLFEVGIIPLKLSFLFSSRKKIFQGSIQLSREDPTGVVSTQRLWLSSNQ